MLALTLVVQAATETVTHGAAATEAGGLSAIGLDFRALLFQLLNFAILLGLLKRFAYKPIMRVLDARRETIQESLRTAAEVAQARERLEKDRRMILAQAETEAHTIVQQSKQQAAETKAEVEAAAAARAEQIVQQGQARLEQEIGRARGQIKREVASLVAAATEKIIDVKLDERKDAALIAQALQEAKAAK